MSDAWFVSANNQMFGPYAHEHMRGFVEQKRLGAQSLVRLGETGEFVTAAQHAALSRLFETEDLRSSTTDHNSDHHVRVERTRVSDTGNAQTSNFAVIVDFRSGSILKFESEIKKLGRVFRVNTAVWLLQSELPSNSIKKALAPHIGASDPLLIIDAKHNGLAWHNLDVMQASHVRELWKMPNERG
jgi:hypothetical protein